MNKLLVVVDMQKDFIDGSLGTKEAEGIVSAVSETIKSFEGPIMVTMDTHSENYINSREGNYLPVVHCIENTDGWQLNPVIEKSLEGKNVTIFKKPTFGSRALAEEISVINEKSPLEEIIFVGLCTGICVISNVLTVKAFVPEVKITVLSSCCACVTPKSHETALEAMKLCQINIQ